MAVTGPCKHRTELSVLETHVPRLGIDHGVERIDDACKHGKEDRNGGAHDRVGQVDGHVQSISILMAPAKIVRMARREDADALEKVEQAVIVGKGRLVRMVLDVLPLQHKRERAQFQWQKASKN